MSSPPLQPQQDASLQSEFHVEVIGSQESLDLDCGKFYTVCVLPSCVMSCLCEGHLCCSQEYILRCTWIEHNETPEIWDVVRRYREFCAIDILLREKYPSLAATFPDLPSKKYIGSSLSVDFVDKRQRDLGYYIMSILHSFPLLVQDEIVDSFLDIRRHILERAREKNSARRSTSTPTYNKDGSNS
ncbi:hypothetical protein PsorP6_003840 [Peronosclerospora sorghi]|uniref:Uncharacterized protein n=1 Tax=Peronosclerospora sorghi TaxID=230839 RepID=A0ACC0VQM4_9STRA|nr:hypothetical protein PsorP6_003840 [Peronosclerospora sorghi]